MLTSMIYLPVQWAKIVCIKTLVGLMLIGVATIHVAHAASDNSVKPADEGTNPWSLKIGSWVCNSPESYDKIVEQQRKGSQSAYALQKQHKDTCLYMDDDNIEDLIQPFITIQGTEHDKTKVEFFIEFYKRVEFLHRRIQHVKFVGWTATDNVKRMFD